MNLSESLPRKNHIEFEKYGVKIELDFIWWIWDKEKGVSLTWSATKLTITKQNWEKSIWLIDFWMFQWCENALKYNEILPFDLKEINFVLITHTHIDHIWKMLHFAKDEFTWTIWTTKINKEIWHIMLSDIIKLQPENEKNIIEKIENEIQSYKKLKQKISSKLWEDSDAIIGVDEIIHEAKEKLKKEKIKYKWYKKEYFDQDDLNKVLEKTNYIDYYTKVELEDNIQLSFISAWHLPWSAQAIIKIKADKNKYINLWFSWDIWKFKNPAVWWEPDTTKEKLDIYLMESTYAGRFHPEFQKEINKLIEAINKTVKNKWKIIIPVFMQWRAQELALYLMKLKKSRSIPNIPIFFHSNNIEKIIEIYKRYSPNIFWDLTINKEVIKAITWKWAGQQKNFEKYKWSAILLASWWMMDGWTIQNYFEYLQDPNNLFISVWYQWEWTLWNKIFHKKNKEIEIPWIWIITINTKLLNLRWFSGHWDQNDLLELIKWVSFSKNAKIIINHWEKTPEQILFWYAIKWIVWNTKEVLIAEFDEKYYKFRSNCKKCVDDLTRI